MHGRQHTGTLPLGSAAAQPAHWPRPGPSRSRWGRDWPGHRAHPPARCAREGQACARAGSRARGDRGRAVSADPGRVVYQFPKNKAETIRATLKQYGGHTLADPRTFYEAETDSPEVEWLPTKKGISIRLDLLPELKTAIDKLIEAAAHPP